VADECVGEVKSLLAKNEDPVWFVNIDEVFIKEHGYLTVWQEADELTSILPLKSSEISWAMWLKDDMLRLSPSTQVLAEQEAYYMLKSRLLRDVDHADIHELKEYLDIWVNGSSHDMSREAREARSLFISKLESAKSDDIRLLSEPLKEQRTSICGRMSLIERASQWWTERLESDEMQRLWSQWWLVNEGQLWGGLREIDAKLRELPDQLYNDIGNRDAVLSRLYYMMTPRKALDAILTLLMLRELTCRHLGIEMKPMIEKEYGRDEEPVEADESVPDSLVYLNTSRGQKIDLIRTLYVMFEQGRFKGKDNSKLTKKDFFASMGSMLHVDLSNYDKDLSRAMTDGTTLQKHIRVFEDMKDTMIAIWNSR